MKLTELFLADLEREAGPTRRLIERVPEGRDDWKPHEKSMQLGYLSSLVATMPGWIALMIDQDAIDLATGSTEGFTPQQVTGNRSLVDAFDNSVAKSRESLTKTTDDHLLTKWQLRFGERVLMEHVRHVAIAENLRHFAHHRGQLTVYLRLNDIPVPSIYGPTADEKF